MGITCWRRVRRAWVLAAACGLLPAAAQAPLDVRVALVIGNGAYAHGGALPNPAADAREMAAVLTRLGFSVRTVQDGSRAQMEQALADTQAALKGRRAIGLLFYAGHGLQVDWHNFMLPVDARIATAADVPAQALSLDAALEAYKIAGTRMNIVVLDACRDNPFPQAAGGKGLAPLDAPPGTFLAFATAPGNVALDGDAVSGHSPYSAALLQELPRPAARIEDVFKRVRLAVRLQSQGRQIPWEATSLEEDFYFQPPGAATRAPADAALQEELAAWSRARAAATAAAAVAYLQQYPHGHFSELAQAQLDRLDRPGVVPKFRPDDALANDTTTERFRIGDEYLYASTGRAQGSPEQRLRVTGIADGVVEFNRGKLRTDMLGNVLGRREKAWVDAQFLPSEYAVGKRWDALAAIETDKREDRVHLQARVAARERIRVAAGEYDVFRVEIVGRGAEGHTYTWTYWMNPRLGLPVKWIEARSNPRGRPTRHVVHELAALSVNR